MDPAALLAEVRALRQAVEGEALRHLAAWGLSPPYPPSLHNLARYLALRRRELRPLQRALMPHGLSSLGRLESRVAETLRALEAALASLAGEAPYPGGQDPEAFFAGERLLEARTEALFGPPRPGRTVRVLVTLPEEAASPEAILALHRAGMDAVRLNLGKLPEEAWSSFLGALREAGEALGGPLPLLLDLEGPRLRALVREPARVRTEDLLALELRGEAPPGLPALAPDRPGLLALREGDRLSLDEGRLVAEVLEPTPYGFLLRVAFAPPKGFRLKTGRALNAPLAPGAPYLGARDRRVLALAQEVGALVGLSFVRTREDLAPLPEGLAGVVLKLEAREAVANLPALLAAASRFPTAAMIARGDLGVELGPERAAEVGEELLWLLEAAHTPAVWATHVLDRLVRKGTPSRAELADAVMGARAEVVMLNQGPFLQQAVGLLDGILRRMEAHQHKKTPRLRALGSWPLPGEGA